MPKSGSELARFIRQALIDKKYKNLNWVDESQQVFSLLRIHKNSKDWPEEYGYIFHDWHNSKSRNGNNNKWSDMYQRLLQALQKGPIIKKLKRTTTGVYYHFVPGDTGSVDPGPPLYAECTTVGENIEIENQVESNVIFSSAGSPESGYASNTEVCNLNDLEDDYSNSIKAIEKINLDDMKKIGKGYVDPGPTLHAEWETHNMEIENQVESNVVLSSPRSPESGYASNTEVCYLNDLVDNNKTDYCGNSMDKILWMQQLDVGGNTRDNFNIVEFVDDDKIDCSGSRMDIYNLAGFVGDNKTDCSGCIIADYNMDDALALLNAQINEKFFDGIETPTSVSSSSAESNVKKEIGNGLPLCLKVSIDVLDIALKNMTQEEDGEWVLQFPSGTNICNLQNEK